MLLIPTTVGKFLLLRHLEMVSLFKQEILTHPPRRGMVQEPAVKKWDLYYILCSENWMSVSRMSPGHMCMCQLSRFREVNSNITCLFLFLGILAVLLDLHLTVRMFNFGIDESNWFQHSSTPKTILGPLFHSSLVDLPIERTLFELVCPIPGRASCYRYPRWKLA